MCYISFVTYSRGCIIEHRIGNNVYIYSWDDDFVLDVVINCYRNKIRTTNITEKHDAINIKQSCVMCSCDIKEIYPDSMCSIHLSDKIQLICQMYMVNGMMETLIFLTTNELHRQNIKRKCTGVGITLILFSQEI